MNLKKYKYQVLTTADNNKDCSDSESSTSDSSSSSDQDDSSVGSSASTTSVISQPDKTTSGNMKRTMKPKHVLESKRVFELLVKMNLHTIQNNRKLTKEFAYDIIPIFQGWPGIATKWLVFHI